MSTTNLTVAALGRPFTLGMLYDARKDELIPGLTLWDDTVLQGNTTNNSQLSSAFEISASDTIESKSSLLDVNASLKASFLGGLIEVGGSAKYLNDTKKYQNQSRLTFQYKATTSFKQLSMSSLVSTDIFQQELIEKDLATHVVTGILYGANAVFVFDSEKLDASRVQDIQGSMEAVVKKIPSFSLEGRVDIRLSEAEKALTQKFSCKFYGDFILDINPATFEDAVRTYVELPKLLGKNGELGVPLKVWLMPLKNLHTSAPVLMTEISIGLVSKVQDAVEDLRQLRMRCNDCLSDSVVEKFPHIQDELKRFQQLCGYYTSNLQEAFRGKLPAIREGKVDESSAVHLFDERDKSPFSTNKLMMWLSNKEREINVIRSCLQSMDGIQVVQNQSELDREVFAPGVEHAMCFVFTSTEKGDSVLDVMAKYLKTPVLGSSDEGLWFFSNEILTQMRKQAKVFSDLAKGLNNNSRYSFLIAAMANKKYRGSTIYHYKNGALVTDGFTKPAITDVKNIKDKSNLMWYATDLTLDPNTAQYNLILSQGNKKVAYGGRQSYPDHPERFDILTQVLCKEGLTGRHYWEVEWGNGDDESTYILFAYIGIERKGRSDRSEIGCNLISWGFGKRSDERKYKAYHNGLIWQGPFLSLGCSRVGVYLDWPGGTLSFYRVSSNHLTHLYTFNTKFTEPVYPGLWASRANNYADFCPIE